MENHNLKSESEVIEIKNLPINNKIPIEFSKYRQNLIIIFSIIFCCIILFFSFIIFLQALKYNKFNILEKEKEIEDLKVQLNSITKKKIYLENKEKYKVNDSSSFINKEFL